MVSIGAHKHDFLFILRCRAKRFSFLSEGNLIIPSLATSYNTIRSEILQITELIDQSAERLNLSMQEVSVRMPVTMLHAPKRVRWKMKNNIWPIFRCHQKYRHSTRTELSPISSYNRYVQFNVIQIDPKAACQQNCLKRWIDIFSYLFSKYFSVQNLFSVLAGCFSYKCREAFGWIKIVFVRFWVTMFLVNK